MSVVIYIVLVLLLATAGYFLMRGLPLIAKIMVIGFGVALLLSPVYVSDAAGGFQDYWAPAWVPAFFENLFSGDVTNLGRRAKNNLLVGGFVGLVISGIVAFFVRNR